MAIQCQRCDRLLTNFERKIGLTRCRACEFGQRQPTDQPQFSLSRAEQVRRQIPDGGSTSAVKRGEALAHGGGPAGSRAAALLSVDELVRRAANQDRRVQQTGGVPCQSYSNMPVVRMSGGQSSEEAEDNSSRLRKQRGWWRSPIAALAYGFRMLICGLGLLLGAASATAGAGVLYLYVIWAARVWWFFPMPILGLSLIGLGFNCAHEGLTNLLSPSEPPVTLRPRPAGAPETPAVASHPLISALPAPDRL